MAPQSPLSLPLQVPRAQGTSCSSPRICQHNSAGDWPVTKLHQLGPVDKTYTYRLMHPSQARDQLEGKETNCWGQGPL